MDNLKEGRAINDRPEKKNKSMAIISNTDEEFVRCEMDTDDGISDAMVLLGRQFYQVLTRLNKKSRPNIKNMLFDINKNNIGQWKVRTKDECEGFGHVRAECPTFLKKQNKGMSASCSDDDSEEKKDDDKANHVMIQTRKEWKPDD